MVFLWSFIWNAFILFCMLLNVMVILQVFEFITCSAATFFNKPGRMEVNEPIHSLFYGTVVRSAQTQARSSSFFDGISLPTSDPRSNSASIRAWLLLYLISHHRTVACMMPNIIKQEAGHAISALTENISISSTGLFIMGIYPGAFVQLDQIAMRMLHPLRKLRIICAGVWHNIVLSLLAYLALYSLPLLLLPAYTNFCSPDARNDTIQQGIIVLEVVKVPFLRII